MTRILLTFLCIAFLASTSVRAQDSEEHTKAKRSPSVLKETGKFDPQKLIGLSLDTVRVFFAMIGRVTEETQNGETHLHALAADSMSHGIRPSEADAIVGPHGSRAFTVSFYKLGPEQLAKLGAKDFSGGKVLSYSGELEWPTMLGHVEMNAKTGLFSLACRPK